MQKSIEMMKKELGTVTTIVIAHRLSTVRHADSLIVMKKGKIIEHGNHESILRDYPKGTYAKLVEEHEKAEKANEEEEKKEAKAKPEPA